MYKSYVECLRKRYNQFKIVTKKFKIPLCQLFKLVPEMPITDIKVEMNNADTKKSVHLSFACNHKRVV